jgi:hypothetical protein
MGNEEIELQTFIKLEQAFLDISKGLLFDSNIFYAGNPFTDEQRSEYRLQQLKNLGLWPVRNVETEEEMKFLMQRLEKWSNKWAEIRSHILGLEEHNDKLIKQFNELNERYFKIERENRILIEQNQKLLRG